jgi:fumarate reductase subunit D
MGLQNSHFWHRLHFSMKSARFGIGPFGLPWQNVMVIFAMLYMGENGVAYLMPKGRFPAWAAAFIWVMVVLISRSGARRLWHEIAGARQRRTGGWWVIGAASVISALAQGPHLMAAGIRGLSTFVLLLASAPWFLRKEQFSTLPSP